MTRPLTRSAALIALAAASLMSANAATAQDDTETQVDPSTLSTEDRLSRLETGLDVIARQREVDQEIADTAASRNPTVELGKKGFKVTSADKNYEFSITGGIQIDQRAYLDDDASLGRNDILARRIRPTFQFKAGNASFRLTPDFALTNVTYMDAWVDYKFSDYATVRVGKSKTAVGYERNQSFPDLVFVERGHATNLAPSRDFGIQVFGAIVPGLVDYQLGVFNGSADLANNFNDGDEHQDIHARLGVTPFANSPWVALQSLTLGLAASSGDREGSTASPLLGAYKSPGQLDVFKYSTGVFALGKHSRLNPYLSWYYGPFGLLAEEITSTQNVALGNSHAELEHKALTVAGSWVVTGEPQGFKGGVKPAHDFDLSSGGWGAWEVALRYGYTDIDDDTFPVFASLAASVSKAESYGLGVSWYLSENLKLLVNYDETTFIGGAAANADRPTETFLVSRVQVRY